MPVTPSYQPGQIQNTPLPGVHFNDNVSAASFGGNNAEGMMQFAQGLGRAGQTASAIGNDIQEHINDSTVRDALNADQTAARDYMNTNILNRQGNQIAGSTSAAQTALAKIGQTRMESLQNDAQKEKYKNYWANVQESHVAHAQTFEVAGVKQFDQQTKIAHAQNLVNDAAQYWNDPNNAREKFQDGLANIGNVYQTQGEDVVKIKKQEFTDHFVNSLVDAASASSPADALALLQKYKGDMSSPAYLSLDAKFKKLATDQIVQTAANQANAEGLDVVQARDKISKSVPADQVESAMGVFKTIQAEKASLAKQNEVKMTNDAYMAQAKDPKAPYPSWMNAEQIVKYNENAQKMIKGVDEQTKKQTYGDLISQFSKDPQGFAKNTSLYQYYASLDPVDYNHLQSVVDRILKGEDKETPNYKAGLEIAKKAMTNTSYFKTSPTTGWTDAARAQGLQRQNEFMADVSRRIQALPDDQRGDYKKIQAIVDDEMKDRVLNNTDKDWIPFNTKTAKNFEVNQDVLKPGDKVTDVPSMRETLMQDKTIPDKTKAAYLIREDVRDGKITKDQARQKLQQIGY